MFMVIPGQNGLDMSDLEVVAEPAATGGEEWVRWSGFLHRPLETVVRVPRASSADVLVGPSGHVVVWGAPGAARAHPCEEEIARVAQFLDVEARNLLILEMQTQDPRLRFVRMDLDRRVLAFIAAREQCAAQVRAEQGGGGWGSGGSAGCSKDTDCKGDRICVSGACVDP